MAADTNDQFQIAHQFLRQTSQRLPDQIPNKPEDVYRIEPNTVGDCIFITANPLDDHAIAHIEKWPAFFALSVQIDLPDSHQVTPKLHETLTEILTATVKTQGGIWFHWKGPLYGCLLPLSDPQMARSIAAEIQQNLAKNRPETITIGVAQYPLLAFDHNQTLSNACKAIDHAAFFGPGGTAIFDAVTLNISGDRHYQNGHLHAAIGEYRDALALDPEDTNVHNSLGVCWADLGNHQKARDCFQTVMNLSPDDVMATYNLGLIHLLEKNDQRALSLFEKAYAQDPNTFQIAFHIGKLLFDQGDLHKSKPFLEKAVSLDPNRNGTLCLLAQCFEAEEKYTDAIKAYEKAVKANPNDSSALSALGNLYDHIGENPDICLTFSRQSVALSPRNSSFRFRLARLYQKYGQLELALKEYDRAAALGHKCQKEIEELSARLGTKSNPGIKCA